MLTANKHNNFDNNYQQVDTKNCNNSMPYESSLKNNSFSHDPYKSYVEDNQPENQQLSGTFIHEPYDIKGFSYINPKLKF